MITTPQQLEDALRAGAVSGSGEIVNAHTAMSVAAVYACVRIISGAVATLPLHIKRRVDERTREDASDTDLWRVLRRKPNRWQKPAQFRRMMQAHVLLRGNAYAMIVWSRDKVQELIPLHPDRVQVKQKDDLGLEYIWTRKDGRRVVFGQADILHLYGLTLDGIGGVTPITYARESIGLALSMERHGAIVFKNGATASGVLKVDKQLTPQARENLRESLEEYRAGGSREGKALVLEEGLDYKEISMTAEDAQWIEARKFSRSDIAMFFGVPPSMMGDNSGNDSNWGTGLEQKSNGFRTYCLEDHLTMWEEGVTCDLIRDDDTLYAKFNRAAMAQADIKTRNAAYVQALQWGWMSPNEIRALEDMNPRDGGDIFYPPPNTAGKSEQEKPDDDPQPA
ncbi:phage portal protein [Tardibacter chloracetimidivorans]|uniref:phage portal protein n=1 Tax=Tardibacter chloracetimidivorans TaxID=1921510 RepID=UPI000AE5CF04|nr:phage portal protein [Tardibacter chloracetimidivorans]